MGSTSIIILVIGVAMLALLAIWLFRPPKESNTIIQLDQRQSMKIDSTDDGKIKIEILYDTWEDRPSDGELFPDITNDAITPPAYGHDLWDKVLNFDKLSAEDKEFVTSVLAEKGFIRKDEVAEFAMGAEPDGHDPDEPVNPNPADREPDVDDDSDDSDASASDNNPDYIPDF